MADAARARKVAERIKVLIAQGLEILVKDPRLGFVTITDVRVTGDLQQATAFYTVLGDDDQREQTAHVLEHYRGRLRSHVGKGLGIRLTPTLEFVLDALPEDAAYLEGLLREAQERDSELAAARTVGEFAGESDPYRKPRDPEADDDQGARSTRQRAVWQDEELLGDLSEEDAGSDLPR